jgi:hypothetical protein
MRKARGVLAAFAALWTILLSGIVAHADEGWVILNFHSDITIAADSTLTIREDIFVDFLGQQKHGIFRTIPLRYRYDDTHDRFYELNVESVTDNQGSVPYDDYIDSDNQVIKIGDPNRTTSGRHMYAITYTVRGAMNSFADHDELFWNVDGSLWPVPKMVVGATVHPPAGSLRDSACYQGEPGSTETCTHVNSGAIANFTSTRELASGEEMSVAVSLNPGAVTIPAPMLESRQRQFPQDAFDATPVTIGLFLILTLLGVGLVGWNWLRHGRDRAYVTR